MKDRLVLNFSPVQAVEDSNGFPCFLVERGAYRHGDIVRYHEEGRARSGRLALSRYAQDVAFDLAYVNPLHEHTVSAEVVRDAGGGQFSVSVRQARGFAIGEVLHVMLADGSLQSGAIVAIMPPVVVAEPFTVVHAEIRALRR